MSKHYDVVIIGSGMVGSTLAIALAQQSQLSIAVIEAQPLSPLAVDDIPDLRVSAITQASQTLLSNLGIWSRLIPERISQFSDMHVWESNQHSVHFDAAEIGQSHLGHIIENRHLQQACLSRIKDFPHIELICPATLIDLNNNTLTLDNGMKLSADLVVGADGARSSLRQQLKIDSKGWSYQQSAIVCTVTTEQPHQYTAWQRFLPEGPLAFLPLADPHQCSIVWTNSTEEAELLSQLNDDDFKVTLGKAFELTLGNITDISQRAHFPLKLSHAKDYIQSGFALVGDAAHTIHPLAGQGVNIGLLDAATLAEVVLEASSKERQIGSIHTLSKYQRRRKGDNVAIQMAMEAFHRVFGSDLAPIKWLRQVGLSSVNKSSLLKTLFMKNASGHRFANPKISKN
jgi:2-octaprenylphenol hydroxylase